MKFGTIDEFRAVRGTFPILPKKKKKTRHNSTRNVYIPFMESIQINIKCLLLFKFPSFERQKPFSLFVSHSFASFLVVDVVGRKTHDITAKTKHTKHHVNKAPQVTTDELYQTTRTVTGHKKTTLKKLRNNDHAVLQKITGGSTDWNQNDNESDNISFGNGNDNGHRPWTTRLHM